MVGRIKAAADARVDADLVIVARTDARTTEGLGAALDRAEAYREAGADVLFVESPESAAEMRTICDRFRLGAGAGQPRQGGRTPTPPTPQLEAIGYRVAIFPNSLTRVFAPAPTSWPCCGQRARPTAIAIACSTTASSGRSSTTTRG